MLLPLFRKYMVFNLPLETQKMINSNNREQWPENGLEAVNICPVCGSTERKVLYPALHDIVFKCAPGKWTLWECTACHSAYLNPRPNRETIHLAYATYYTHYTPPTKEIYETLAKIRQWRRRIVNGYTKWRFGSKEAPSSWLGLLLHFMPLFRIKLEHEYRHLPRAPHGGRVLDVGCGNGAFLHYAARCGWSVTGLELDTASVENARKSGLADIRQGGLEVLDNQSQIFDVITICHVIEHMHDPVRFFKDAYRLLKPDGMLWVETPNIGGYGHQRFKNDWRGLEPPRHLVIFNASSLRQAILKVGFTNYSYHYVPSPLKGMFEVSAAIRKSRTESTDNSQQIGLALTIKIWMLNLLSLFWPRRREFLVISAQKRS